MLRNYFRLFNSLSILKIGHLLIITLNATGMPCAWHMDINPIHRFFCVYQIAFLYYCLRINFDDGAIVAAAAKSVPCLEGHFPARMLICAPIRHISNKNNNERVNTQFPSVATTVHCAVYVLHDKRRLNKPICHSCLSAFRVILFRFRWDFIHFAEHDILHKSNGKFCISHCVSHRIQFKNSEPLKQIIGRIGTMRSLSFDPYKVINLFAIQIFASSLFSIMN